MLFIGSDHAGFKLKEKIKRFLKVKYSDLSLEYDKKDDYSDVVLKLTRKFKKNDKAILICMTGNGMCIAANKSRKMRAANCDSIAKVKLARKHNDINVLCLGTKFVDFELSKKIIKEFLNTKFEKGRHLRRVKKINKII